MFSDNKYLTSEDVESDGMFNSINIDSIPDGSKKMDLKFNNQYEIYLYAPCNDSDLARIAKDKSMLTKMFYYESLNTAKIHNNSMQRTDKILEVVVDTRHGLDFLNPYDLNQLRRYYEWGIKNKTVSKSIEEVDLINEYIAQNKGKIKLLRYLRQTEKKLYQKSKLTVGHFVVYKIYDVSIIKSMKELR